MKKLKYATFILLLSSVLMGCVSNKKFIYMQKHGNTQTDSNGVMPVLPYSYKLQKGDILYISLSTDDEKLNKVFIPGAGSQPTTQSQNVSGTMFYFIGFTIDNSGEIEFPYLGKIKVSGKSIEEAKQSIDNELRKFFKVFFLQVKVAEFKFSVIGAVNRPGQFFFQQNKVNILEAITQAGDLQGMANKLKLQLYRQYPDGVKMHEIDITDLNVVSSPFWYIQPNDVLYVVPLKARTLGDMSTLQTSFGVVAPLLSALLLVLNTYILVKNL
jgi:polysaccharide export outer membrane protein